MASGRKPIIMTGSIAPKPFRSYVTQRYYDNRDEYDSVGQTQPYTLEEYYQQNKRDLKHDYRKRVRTSTR